MVIIFKKNRKWFIFGLILVFIFSIFFYGFTVETKMQSVKNATLKFSALPSSWENTKIAYFSDTTLGNAYTIESLKTSVKKINAEKPDLIFFGGDFIDETNTATLDQEMIITQLKELQAPLGKYAFLPQASSNQTTSENAKVILEQSGFQILTNENRYIYNRSLEPLNIITINKDVTAEQKAQLLSTSNEAISFLVAETPETFDEIASYTNIKLTLSYGTYGGNIGIPFINGLLAKSDYPAEFYNKDDQQLLVSTGLGTQSNFYFRLLNHPKIYSITIQNQKE